MPRRQLTSLGEPEYTERAFLLDLARTGPLSHRFAAQLLLAERYRIILHEAIRTLPPFAQQAVREHLSSHPHSQR